MRMIISVMRWRGVVDMLGRVLRMRSVASPMMGIRGLPGSSGRTVGDRSGASLVCAPLVPAGSKGVGMTVGVWVGQGVGVWVGIGVCVGVAVAVGVGVGVGVAVGVEVAVGKGVGVAVRVGVGV